MEEAEGSYRTRCSLETLRSGEKGFFRDFSENVVRVAGLQWISKVFGRLNNDEDRIRCIFTDGKIKATVLETLNRTEFLYRDKDAQASRARRLEGFQAATAGEHQKALLLFSQAVLRAPLPGKCEKVDRGFGLPMALLARAETLLTLNEYILAFEDLSHIEETSVPDVLRKDFARLKRACEKSVRENERSLVVKRRDTLTVTENKQPVELSGGKNPRLPAASALLEIENTENAGKRVIANSLINPGDRLVIESPIAAVLSPEFFGTHCHHCFSRFRAPVACPDCSSIAFCNRKCRDAATTSYHKYECKILALLIGSGMSVLSMLALRMVTQNGPNGCLKISSALNQCDVPADKSISKSARRRSRKKKLLESRREQNSETKTEQSKNNEPDLRAYDLVMHEKRRTAKDFFERSLMAAFLLRCLQRVGFFDKPTNDEETPDEKEIAVASLLLKHLQLLQFNAHEVFETRLRTEHRFHGSRPIYIGVAIYPTAARFNHDCYPAVTRYFFGRRIVIRAIRTLRPGDVVAENYGPIFTKRNLEERRITLAGRYWFHCECDACRENWPRLEALTNDVIRLRCPTDGCLKIHRAPSAAYTNKLFECSSCRSQVDLRGSLERVRECEQLYARGVAAMEQEQPEEALETFFEAISKFHSVAVPPHKATHLAEIVASVCMADEGNIYRPDR